MLTDVLRLTAVEWIGTASFTWGRREEGRDGTRKDRRKKQLVSLTAAVPSLKALHHCSIPLFLQDQARNVCQWKHPGSALLQRQNHEVAVPTEVVSLA